MSTYTLNAAALATQHAGTARSMAEAGHMNTAREELDRARVAADLAQRWAAAESTPGTDAPERFAETAREAVAEAEAAVTAAAGRTPGAERVTAPVSGVTLELMPADADGTREAREAGILRGWIERRVKPGTASVIQFRAAWPTSEAGWKNGRARGLWNTYRGAALNELIYMTRREAADMIRDNVWAASAADEAEADRAADAPEPVAAEAPAELRERMAAADADADLWAEMVECGAAAETAAEPVAAPVTAPEAPEARGDAEAPAEPVAEPVATCPDCGRPARGDGEYSAVCVAWPTCVPAEPVAAPVTAPEAPEARGDAEAPADGFWSGYSNREAAELWAEMEAERAEADRAAEAAELPTEPGPLGDEWTADAREWERSQGYAPGAHVFMLRCSRREFRPRIIDGGTAWERDHTARTDPYAWQEFPAVSPVVGYWAEFPSAADVFRALEAARREWRVAPADADTVRMARELTERAAPGAGADGSVSWETSLALRPYWSRGQREWAADHAMPGAVTDGR